MKKTVNFAKMIICTAYLMLIVSLVAKDVISYQTNAKLEKDLSYIQTADFKIPITLVLESPWERRLGWFAFASGVFMFFAFLITVHNSVPKSKIEQGQAYKIEKVISHSYRDHTVVLNHDKNIETFRCRYVADLETLQKDQFYTIKQINGDLFFTLV